MKWVEVRPVKGTGRSPKIDNRPYRAGTVLRADPDEIQNLSDYMAQGTLGRLIVDGAPKVRILGQEYQVKARIAKINGFSGHADRDELLRWLSGFKTPPRHLFVVHGEPETANKFANMVKEKLNWQVSVPSYENEFILD